MSIGARNLTILGVVVVLFALVNTIISLTIYHNSGDIYLDRSRPGFLPDESEISSDDSATSYSFSVSGRLTTADLEDFIEHYQAEVEKLQSYDYAFSDTPLSDDALGIPTE